MGCGVLVHLVNNDASFLRLTSVYSADAIVASGVLPWHSSRPLSTASLHNMGAILLCVQLERRCDWKGELKGGWPDGMGWGLAHHVAPCAGAHASQRRRTCTHPHAVARMSETHGIGLRSAPCAASAARLVMSPVVIRRRSMRKTATAADLNFPPKLTWYKDSQRY